MNKQVLRLAIPNIISNITIPLLGMADLAILGRLESEVYIGAIALGTMIFNFIYWGFGFLRMGTSGFTAQAYGANNRAELTAILYRSLMVAGLGSALIILLQKPIALLSFFIINGSQEVEFLAAEYFYIRIWAAPATIGIYALTGWFLGMQNAKIPMVIAIVINLVNVGLNMFFVFTLGMKSDGVALGTLISQYIGFILAIILFLKYYNNYKVFPAPPDTFKWAHLKRFFLVNKDILIRTICLIFTFSFFTAKSASENDMILAVNTLLLQFLFFFSYLIDGFAYAAEALVGRFKGASNLFKLKETISTLFKWGFFISLPFTLIYLLAGDLIVRILTTNQELIDASHEFMYWVVVIPILTFPAFLYDGIYIGATAARAMRNALLVSTLIVFVPVYFVSKMYIGNHGLWLAMILFMISRGVYLHLVRKQEILSA